MRPHQPLDLVARRSGHLPVGREHLQRAERRAEPAFVADADHDRGAVWRRPRDQAERHYLSVLLRADGGGAVAGGAHHRIAAGRAAADHGPVPAIRPRPDKADVRGHAEQRQHVLVRAVTAPGRAEPLRACSMRGQVRVNPTLDIHVLPAREPLRNQHHLGQLAAQMPGDPQRQRGRTRLLAQRLSRQLQQLAQATRQPSQVITVSSRPPGWGWGTHRPTMLDGRPQCQGNAAGSCEPDSRPAVTGTHTRHRSGPGYAGFASAGPSGSSRNRRQPRCRGRRIPATRRRRSGRMPHCLGPAAVRAE